MHVTKDEMKCENVNWKMWWYEEDFECNMKLTRIQEMYICQLIPTHYDKHQIITSWADERVEDEGYEMTMNDINNAGSKVPRGQSSREIG